MRSYPTDSPQAAARILALALIADGHLSREELDAIDCCDAREQLGIAPEALHDVVRTLCEDLLASSCGDWAAACTLGPQALESLLDEIRDPLLRLKVLQLCLAAVSADGHVAPGESAVVRAALLRWDLAGAWPAGRQREAA